MRIPSFLRRILVSMALIAGTFTAFLPCSHASLDDFIAKYQQIESKAPPNSLPVASADIIAYKSLFNCIEGGKDVLVCTDEFHDTDAGEQAGDSAEIPEAIWQVLNAYVAWKEGDVWGVIQYLGTAAACAILQVLAGGADICGFIDALVDAAEALVDAGKAVGKFLESVGETAVNAINDFGCALDLWGDCEDEPPPPPPEVSAYKQYFHPKVADKSGLKLREDKNKLAFPNLVDQLSSQAKQKYGATPAVKAASMFTSAVNEQWTADIGSVALPALAAKRQTYNVAQKQQNVSAAAQAALAAWKSAKTHPMQSVPADCANDFSEFLHVDYWISDPQFQSVWKQLGSPHGTGQWCSQTFWYGNKDAFAKAFHGIMAPFCPGAGQQLLCAKVPDFEACVELMGSVGQKDQCIPNVQALGDQVATEIKAYFKGKGSTHGCDVLKMGLASPVVLSCSRPTQVHHCDKYYKAHYGTLPVKVLTCALGNVPAAYTQKESKLWTETIPGLKGGHPSLGTYVSQKGPDPLAIVVPPALYAELQADPKTKDLDKKIVISPEPSIDGVDTPTLASNLGPKLKESAKDTIPANALSKEALGGVNPPDPAGKLPAQQIAGNAAVQTGNLSTGAANAGGGKQLAGNATNTVAQPGNLAPPTGAQSIGQTKALSGDAPPGFGGPKAKPDSGPVQPIPAISLPPALADITSSPLILVGVQQGTWGGTVNVDASQARRQAKGICEFAIRHSTRNIGKGPAATFSRQWTNGSVPGTWMMDYPSIAPGGAIDQTDTLPLKPGMNALTLWLDRGGKVAEQLESNNQFVVRVNVAGNCGTIAARQSPDADNRPGGPSRPAPPTR